MKKLSAFIMAATLAGVFELAAAKSNHHIVSQNGVLITGKNITAQQDTTKKKKDKKTTPNPNPTPTPSPNPPNPSPNSPTSPSPTSPSNPTTPPNHG